MQATALGSMRDTETNTQAVGTALVRRLGFQVHAGGGANRNANSLNAAVRMVCGLSHTERMESLLSKSWGWGGDSVRWKPREHRAKQHRMPGWGGGWEDPPYSKGPSVCRGDQQRS